jgi:formylglycine-generating enzyme required for sulfatase activity
MSSLGGPVANRAQRLRNKVFGLVVLSPIACEVVAPLGPPPSGSGAARATDAGAPDRNAGGAPPAAGEGGSPNQAEAAGTGGTAGKSGSSPGGARGSGGSRPTEMPGKDGSGAAGGAAGHEPDGAGRSGARAAGSTSAPWQLEAGTGGVGGVAEAGASGLGGVAEAGANAGGEAGARPTSERPSCRAATLECGPDAADCCDSTLVPGGVFSFGLGGYPPSLARVASFYLDTFEVTVGRFNAFLDDFDAWRRAGNPVSGANTLPDVPNSGWNSEWDDLLATDAASLRASLRLCERYSTVDGDENLPITCMSWEEAFAFCLWDGARLPTSVEWEYAAIGGDEYRTYPWGSAPLSHARVIYNCLGDDIDGCERTDIVPVGSRPAGRGRWGQYDLLGSTFEYVFDYDGDYPATCSNCALAEGLHRTFRGGSWFSTNVESIRRDYFDPWARDGQEGFRCARRPR